MNDQSIFISVSEPRKARRGIFSPIVYTINSKVKQETRNRWERPENTHLLCEGKYHCVADLRFHRFGLDQTCKSVDDFFLIKGAFKQSVLRGVIRRRLGYVINKKYFFIKKTTILRRVIRRGVNATKVAESKPAKRQVSRAYVPLQRHCLYKGI